MAPILGIYASQISGHLFAPSGAYDSIATATVGAGGTTEITFSSIPSTYTHLQIRMYTNNNSNPANAMRFTYNADTSEINYRNHYLYGTGSAVGSLTDGNTRNNGVMGSTSGPGVSVVDILDYANTNKYTTTRLLNGYDANGNGYVFYCSSLWMNTAAITSISVGVAAGSFGQYSQFALYGIRGGN